MRRRPKARSVHRNVTFTTGGTKMNDAHALQIAVERFRLYPAGDLLSIRGRGRSR
jgi:hypothetical protein